LFDSLEDSYRYICVLLPQLLMYLSPMMKMQMPPLAILLVLHCVAGSIGQASPCDGHVSCAATTGQPLMQKSGKLNAVMHLGEDMAEKEQENVKEPAGEQTAIDKPVADEGRRLETSEDLTVGTETRVEGDKVARLILKMSNQLQAIDSENKDLRRRFQALEADHQTMQLRVKTAEAGLASMQESESELMESTLQETPNDEHQQFPQPSPQEGPPTPPAPMSQSFFSQESPPPPPEAAQSLTQFNSTSQNYFVGYCKTCPSGYRWNGWVRATEMQEHFIFQDQWSPDTHKSHGWVVHSWVESKKAPGLDEYSQQKYTHTRHRRWMYKCWSAYSTVQGHGRDCKGWDHPTWGSELGKHVDIECNQHKFKELLKNSPGVVWAPLCRQ